MECDRGLDAALALMARQLQAVLSNEAMPQAERNALAGDLLVMIQKATDVVEAKKWSRELQRAILTSPRLLDGAPGLASTHKIGAFAARVAKASAPDKRTQSHRLKVKAAERGMYGSGESPDKKPSSDLPAFFDKQA